MFNVESMTNYNVTAFTSEPPTPPTCLRSQFYRQAAFLEDEIDREDDMPIQLGGAYIDSDPPPSSFTVSGPIHKQICRSSVLSGDIDDLIHFEILRRNDEVTSNHRSHSSSYSQQLLNYRKDTLAGGSNLESRALHEELELEKSIGLARCNFPILQRMQDQVCANSIGLDSEIDNVDKKICQEMSRATRELRQDRQNSLEWNNKRNLADIEMRQQLFDKSHQPKTPVSADRIALSPDRKALSENQEAKSTERERKVIMERFQRQVNNLKMKERQLKREYQTQKRELKRDLEGIERKQEEFWASHKIYGIQDVAVQEKRKRYPVSRFGQSSELDSLSLGASRQSSQPDILSSVGLDGVDSGNFVGWCEEVRPDCQEQYSARASPRFLRSHVKKSDTEGRRLHFSVKAPPKSPYMRRVQHLFSVKSVQRRMMKWESSSKGENDEDETNDGNDEE